MLVATPTSQTVEVIAQQYHSLRAELVRFARSRMWDGASSAEEIVSAGIEKLLRAHDPSVPVANPRALAYTTIQRLIIDAGRARERHGPEISTDVVEGPDEGGRRAPPLPAGPGHWSNDLEIRNLLEQLPEPQRSFYALITFEDLSVLDAQRSCGWPPKSPHYQYRELNKLVAKLMGLPPRAKEQGP